ncbi:MAG: hypothetical protein ACE37H_16225 [Phycisphaeraceae bacterium]
MKTTCHALALAALMLLLTGCGGSSVDLPEDVMTDEAYAVQWVDFESIKPDEGVKMLGGLADDMSDDQPKARLWLSAEADQIEGDYRERWEAFTDAGCQGVLTVYYRNEVTEGEGEDKKKVAKYRKHTFIKAGKKAKAKDLEEALDEFAEDDGIDDLELEPVGKDTGWFWVTRGESPDGSPKMPKKGDEKTAEAFEKLLAKADDAAIVVAWRMIDGISDEIDDELDREEISDERKEELERAKATQSIVLACSPGTSAQLSARVTFEKSEHAKAYAQEHNDSILDVRASLKKAMINAESPPHPKVIDGVADSMQIKTSGKTATLELDRGAVKDMLTLMSARMGMGGDDTSPVGLLRVESLLQVPDRSDVPGVRSCYDDLKLDRSRQPQ